jgi:tetratricopeptide (TPR) repeat protein
VRSVFLVLALALAAGCGDEPAAPAQATPLTAPEMATLALAVQAQRDGRPEDVGPLLAGLLARAPPPADAQYVAGEAAYALKRHAEAVERLTDAVTRKPEFLPNASTLGFAHYHLGQFAEAATTFRQIVAARPTAYKAHYGLGLVALEEDRLEEARDALAEALRQQPSYLKARFAWGRLLQAEGRFDEAGAAFETVLAGWPSHHEALLRLAQVRAAQGRGAEAAALQERRAQVYAVREELSGLEQLAHSGADTPASWARMAQLLASMGEDEDAARALASGRRRFPAAPELAGDGPAPER